MEKQEIIKKFMALGYQLTNDVLELFVNNPGVIDSVLEKVKIENPKNFIIDGQFAKELVKPESKIKILKSKQHSKTNLKVSDYVNYFNQKYNSLKNLFTNFKEIENLILLNKVSQRTNEFSAIVLINEKNNEEKYILAEDESGEKKIYFDNNILEKFNELIEDEVVGLKCFLFNEEIKVKDVFHPDIPIKKEINKTVEDIFCIFISDFHFDNKGFNIESYAKFLEWLKSQNHKNTYLFVLGDISQIKNDIIKFLKELPQNCFKIFLKGETDPDIDLFDLNLGGETLLQIENVTVYLSHGMILENYIKNWNTTPENTMLRLLKKRHVNPTFEFDKIIYDNDPYLLDVIPDIIAFGHFHIPNIANYKGTTIVSNGSFVTNPVFWMINLKTRDVNKLEFI